MGKKTVKYILRGILCLFIFLLLVAVAVYLPPVQNFIKNRAVAYVTNNLGMNLSVGSLSIKFPLVLSVRETLITEPQTGDTIVMCERLDLEVALLPLLRSELRFRGFELNNARFGFSDTTGFNLTGRLERFYANPIYVGLKNQTADIGTISLNSASVGLNVGTGSGPDTTTMNVRWAITAEAFELADIAFKMYEQGEETLSVGLRSARADAPNVDIGKQSVVVDLLRVDTCEVSVISQERRTDDPPERPEEVTPADSSSVWDIRAARIELNNINGFYGDPDKTPIAGFDPDYIEVADLNIGLDSAHYREDIIRGEISTLRLRERSGLEITEANGSVSIDSASVNISGFNLNTPYSHISIDANLVSGISEFDRQSPVRARIDAQVSPADLYLFVTLPPSLRNIIAGRTITLDGEFDGSLEHIDIQRLEAIVPGAVILTATGSLNSITGPDDLGGRIVFRSSFPNAPSLLLVIPDTSVRNRISLPRSLTVGGTFDFAGQRYSPDIVITADSGRLAVKGTLEVPSQRYDATVAATDFPLYEFLPRDSLGLASFTVTAVGQGFDPQQDGTTSEIELDIERFDYNKYTYRNITLDAHLAQRVLNGEIHAQDDALILDLALGATLDPGKYEGRLSGRISYADLYRLYLTASPLAVSSDLDVAGSFIPADSIYQGSVKADSVRLIFPERIQRISSVFAQAFAAPDSVAAQVNSGDLRADFYAPISLNYLTSHIGAASRVIGRQIDSMSVDMAVVQDSMPPFRLTAAAGRDNALWQVLSDRKIEFDTLTVSASTLNDAPFHLRARVDGLRTGSIALDSIKVGLLRRDSQLNYYVRLANRPGNIDQLALLWIYGEVEGSQAHANFYQRDRSDSVGFRFGLDVSLLENGLRGSITPLNPTFGYQQWTVNPDNYVTYLYERTLEANVRLDGNDRHFYLGNGSLPSIPEGAIHVDMAGIDIGNVLRLIPSAPDITGTIGSDLTVGLDDGFTAASGTLTVNELHYNKSRIGNFGLDIDYQGDSLRQRLLNADLTINGATALTAKGTFSSEGEGSVDFVADIPGLSLKAANGFIPDDVANINGRLRGNVTAKGTSAEPNVNGQLIFDTTTVEVVPIATTFTIDPSPWIIRNSILSLDESGIISPSGSKLTLDGDIDFAKLSDIGIDMDVYGNNFEFVNSDFFDRSMVYGKGLADIDIQARGKLDALRVRGDISILNGTDLTYTLRSDNLEVEDATQDFVTFISFSDSTLVSMPDSTYTLRTWAMDVLVNVDIQDNVQMTLNISEDGNNRAEIRGEGTLTYSMNSQGDSRFTGRYNISGGTVVYSPPVIRQADFSINDGSYIEWTGDVADPTFNITATEVLRSRVKMDGSKDAQNVNFNVIIEIKNTLQDLSITFDLAAPDNVAIQNQLASLAPEQRSQQAMSLLIYNTYTGPGTTAKVDTSNPINTLIERELNQWARNNLRNVDLSFGLNSVSDAASGNQHTDFSYNVSKSLFDDRVTVKIGGSINPEESTQNNLQNNFVDDITVEYRLTKRDNMFLKAYRYNTQESLLEGEVTETGLGYVIRRKLDRLGDLFRFRRSPAQKEARERRKEIRQEFRDADRRTAGDPARTQRQNTELLTNPDEQEKGAYEVQQ